MINIDTNILVRIYLADDEKQYEAAKSIFASNKTFFISSYTLLEFVWVLRTKKYSRLEIYNAVIELVALNNIVVGKKDLIINSLVRYKKGKADFSDYMILEDGLDCGATELKTFDKKLLCELN